MGEGRLGVAAPSGVHSQHSAHALGADEASPLYTEMIDQTTRGHQFIIKNFGPTALPRGTWQVGCSRHWFPRPNLSRTRHGMKISWWWWRRRWCAVLYLLLVSFLLTLFM